MNSRKKKIVFILLSLLLWTTISAAGILNAAFVMLSGNSHRKRRLVEDSSVLKVSRLSHIINNKRKSRKRRRFWVRPGRSSTWWDNIFSGFVVREEWRENFRMSKESFFNLCNQLRPFLEKKHTNMRGPISVEKQVAVTLYYLSDEGRYRKVANAFGISRAAVSVIIRNVSFVITHHLGPKYCT